MSGRVTIAAIALLAGCAGSAQPRTEHAFRAELAGEPAQRARAATPDLFARAERAAADAERAQTSEARSDDEAIAQLWLEAAIAEADRVAELRGAAEAEARYARALRERAELERRELELERARVRGEAAKAASAEARAAFAISNLREKESEPQPETTARIVRERAMLLLAAARALGFPDTRADALERAIEHAAQQHGKAELAAARAALVDAESALGEARKPRAVDQEEIAALLELARERGLTTEALPSGIAIALDDAFVARSTALSPSGAATIAAIAALARAHPHGALRIETTASDSEAMSRARGARLERELKQRIGEQRVELSATPEPHHTRVVFTAYVLAAAPTPSA